MNSKVTIIIPVSRDYFLERVFHSLEVLECDARNVNLLVIVDGNADLFVKARNFVEMSRFAQRLCVQFKSKHKLKHYDIYARRLRIADIHNEFRKYMAGDFAADYVFGVEDDTIVPPNALRKLMTNYGQYPYAGIIEGVEIGRWGIPYVGAWKADNIYEPTEIQSLELKREGVDEIDAGGFYCFMTKYKDYYNHEFKTFDHNGLGPDVDYGITLRQLGALNYVDWSIKCIHKSKEKDITPDNTEPKIVTFHKNQNRWRETHK